ncbi:MAG: hypothetical protein S4CHLAM7_10180 [Chlamydiae bacterium]|nr:hypothetical protein [Chlamydiota bacterium]
MLYHLIKILKPKTSLEIGTYKGLTAFIIGSALSENEEGHLIKIDPYAEQNSSPKTISEFPNHISTRITQQPLSSALFFQHLLQHPMMFDFILIDGNHEFEFALFDLMCSARFINPNGIVVLDNIDQIRPRKATQEFLTLPLN